jgi:hypothetical protein
MQPDGSTIIPNVLDNVIELLDKYKDHKIPAENFLDKFSVQALIFSSAFQDIFLFQILGKIQC